MTFDQKMASFNAYRNDNVNSWPNDNKSDKLLHHTPVLPQQQKSSIKNNEGQ